MLSSATPFANAQSARTLLKFITKQAGFSDARMFNQYFMDDADSMRLLHFLIDQYVIRIKKKDVFGIYDPDVPLEKQNNRLPQKVYVEPDDLGNYEILPEVTESIYDLFLNWPEWQKAKAALNRQGKAVDTQDDRERKKGGGVLFAKMHSLRQMVNDPRYIGINKESPKHLAMDKIINKEIVKGKGKVVIFCSYKEEVKAYEERYAKYGAVTYYGDTLSDQIDSNGYLVDRETRKQGLFKKINKFEYAIDENGHLIEDTKGAPITALDYNRYLFQNDSDSRIMITTYEKGSVGVTFTAADAVIFDDLPRDYTVMYQAEDRANRIDNLRKKYQTRYYRMEGRYPKVFVNNLKGKYAVINNEGEIEIVDATNERYKEAQENGGKIWDLYQLFAQGTFDQIQGHNIMKVQKKIFELVLDGLEDEQSLNVLSSKQLSDKMPFLVRANGENNEKKADNAQLTTTPEKGGIDLTAAKTPLEIQNSNGEIKFKIDAAMLQQLQNSPGFVPIIINIQPMNDLRMFLGLTDNLSSNRIAST